MNQLLIFAITVCVASHAVQAAPVLGKVATVSGSASVQIARGAPADLQPNSALQVGSILATASGAEVVIAPVPGIGVQLKENSELRLAAADLEPRGKRSAQLDFYAGSLLASHAEGSLQITVPGGVINSSGSSFSVTLSRTGQLLIVVASRFVTLEASGGRTTKIGAGEFIEGEIRNGNVLTVSAPQPAAAHLGARNQLAAIESFTSVTVSGGVAASRSRRGGLGAIPVARGIEGAANPANTAGSVHSNER